MSNPPSPCYSNPSYYSGLESKYDKWLWIGFGFQINMLTKKTYFSQTIAQSETHCFVLKNLLPKWNILEIFFFRPTKMALH